MRSQTVTLLGVITLLGYSAIAAVIQTEEELYQKQFPDLGPPCEGEAACTRVEFCLNASSSGQNVVNISSSVDNPCGHYLFKCCIPTDKIEEPDPSDLFNVADGGDGAESTTVSSVATTASVTPSVTPSKPPSKPLSSLIPQSTGCGLRNVEGINFRIVGGTDNETQYGEYPWMMAILKKADVLGMPNRAVYVCGGSLIHYQVVLTAAHCLHRIQRTDLVVRAGEWDTRTAEEMYQTQDRAVAEIVVHPEYYKGGQQNDVALLFLGSPFRPKKTIHPVCLPPQDTKFDGQTCFATGWGKDRYGKEGTHQTILRHIDLPIVPHDKCQTALRTTDLDEDFTLDKSFICAGGEEGKDTCKGDGGSPLVCSIPSKQQLYYQTGIVSWGIGCGEEGIPGVYTNVALFRSWIDQQMVQRNYDTSSYRP
ncbi:phenoloxidase-activating factor 2-like [Anopheles aquasalis]|uniref:phenoloxidase-activating factor 2-like n=1 Tax=Anopheles aquasalis TaxID=42839 RepID=UPI00215AC620|nr:phenoloxidase-activating factor 2-like [Anopheles aquasalis]